MGVAIVMLDYCLFVSEGSLGESRVEERLICWWWVEDSKQLTLRRAAGQLRLEGWG